MQRDYSELTPTYPAKVYALPTSQAAIGLRCVYFSERILAGLAILAVAPIAILISAVIFALSGRNPLIFHDRVGWNGAPLRMLKFRTMWGGTETADITAHSKHYIDPRVTSRFAAFCRRYSVDEIPQLYHVLTGKMSLVGPRPITREELDLHYGADAGEMLSIRPGLTGLWQVMGRSRLSYGQRRRLDLMLVRRISTALYLRILLRSIPKVLTGAGAW